MHVERAIARIKKFQILHQVVPITIAKELDKIWAVCSYLALFLPPIIVEKTNTCRLKAYYYWLLIVLDVTVT
jgi:hypothetical protein